MRPDHYISIHSKAGGYCHVIFTTHFDTDNAQSRIVEMNYRDVIPMMQMINGVRTRIDIDSETMPRRAAIAKLNELSRQARKRETEIARMLDADNIPHNLKVSDYESRNEARDY